MGIEKMDSSLASMGNLKVLNLSNNKITVLPAHLPPKIQELNLTGNLITEINTGSAVFPSLLHIGVSYNQLNDAALKQIAKTFPKLFCIDISHNRLESLSQAVITLHGLTDLKMLYLIGNPLMLCPGYRNVLKTKLKALKVLDGLPTLNEQESTKKKKKVTGSALGTYG